MMRKKIFAAVGMLLLVIGLCGAKSYMRQMKIRENEEAQKIEKQKEAAQERKETREQRKKQEEEKKQKAKEQQKIIKRQKKIQICIDPGHYSKKNEVYENGKVVYCEGNFTLQVAKELKKILEERYGVIVHLTRTSGNICINGYENLALDSGKISLRGEAAKGMDLFISLHTNANLEHANGVDTNRQPIGITKPIVIVNTVAMESKQALSVANAIGTSLAVSNAKLGISTQEKFHTVSGKDDILNWTDAYNDSVDKEGTVCARRGNNGDYYGVLRGASNVAVPGMIVEHGFHTVPKMRKLAADGTLAKEWAEADAKGIAEGMRLEEE